MPRYAGMTRVVLEEGDLPIAEGKGGVNGGNALLVLPAALSEGVELEGVERAEGGTVTATAAQETSIESVELTGKEERLAPEAAQEGELVQCVLVYDTDLNEFSLEVVDAVCDLADAEPPSKKRKT
eukprot:TRINITY_DN27485_c0_g1_i1.p2 TRINITY_DN27485_c0_g1~~TRINITY_DN27485_c0_g1_i1.p2  ORF type:complete len:126 (+),score=54.69 TRINITY_DN27485_c0_g1_i1:41-418(+)